MWQAAPVRSFMGKYVSNSSSVLCDITLTHNVSSPRRIVVLVCLMCAHRPTQTHTDPQRHTQTQTDTQTDTDTQAHRQTHRHTDTQTYYRHTHPETHTRRYDLDVGIFEAGRTHRFSSTTYYTRTQGDTDRQTDRQTERHTQTLEHTTIQRH